ncbi:MAG: LON peptidase substrate-binding domain-containing protein [Chromatiales bacterium]|nr:LON peptidase substrate-binding domain-containing protein [Chromatiales bacterium]
MKPLTDRIPLFPLGTVLFPGGSLNLRIFERRYLDLIRECARDGTGFGIVAIREGQEAGPPAVPYAVGTYAEIVDFDRLDDGLLGITVAGRQRFRILDTETADSGLHSASVEWLAPVPPHPLPRAFAIVAEVLRQMLGRADGRPAPVETHYDDGAWVAARITELLPLERAEKQHLLELDDAGPQIERLAADLKRLAEHVQNREQ